MTNQILLPPGFHIERNNKHLICCCDNTAVIGGKLCKCKFTIRYDVFKIKGGNHTCQFEIFKNKKDNFAINIH